jgi:alkylation response protein AidB-like acyl-CoA dehydrogenase
MTFAAVPALLAASGSGLRGCARGGAGCGSGGVMKAWVDGLTSGLYDPSDAPIHTKKGLTLGMSMTEKQGGSDVGANTTSAFKVATTTTRDGDGAGDDEELLYSLVGHKWFTSAPMCDGFLTLARVNDQTTTGGQVEGLSCFLVPRWVGEERNQGLQVRSRPPSLIHAQHRSFFSFSRSALCVVFVYCTSNSISLFLLRPFH